MDGFYIIGAILIALLIATLAVNKAGNRAKTSFAILSGAFYGGLLLGTFVYCVMAASQNAAPGLRHLIAVVCGLAGAFVFEKGQGEKTAWLLTGIAAGSQTSMSNRGAYLITGVAASMLIFDLFFSFRRRNLDLLFVCAFLYFFGQASGFFLKEYMPATGDVLFSLGCGAAIYLSSSRILPDDEGGLVNAIGACAGFLLALLAY